MCLPSILNPLTLPSASLMGDRKLVRSSQPLPPPGFCSLTSSQGIFFFETGPWGLRIWKVPGAADLCPRSAPEHVLGAWTVVAVLWGGAVLVWVGAELAGPLEAGHGASPALRPSSSAFSSSQDAAKRSSEDELSFPAHVDTHRSYPVLWDATIIQRSN